MKDERDIEFHVSSLMSMREYEAMPDAALARMQRSLHEQMAAFIAHHKLAVHQTKEYLEHRLTLYVATPEQFWALVNAKAEQIALRYSRTL